VHHYFRQSEQVETVIKVAVEHARDGWRAAALFLQRLPAAGGAKEAADDRWLEALSLMATVTSAELADFALAPNDLLFRLFHEKGVRVYPAKEKELHDQCRCSEERVATMLRSFPRAEIESLKKDGLVEVVCEFCRREYRFDENALDDVYARQARRDGRAESGR
jgi:molecular chaperone Hsp33